ncbi:MAG TPA: ribonuclease Z [Candidatus Pacearchaeota archaeon]|nr:ribonuclease Z [Candidatus Pacearchaeota archaeon]
MAEKIKITFLGTGGLIPSEERSHPAFLLNYRGENILVDCGEGTQTQFRKAKLNPCKITKILITHWHGDHTFGLPGLLRTLSTSGYNKKLFIYGPRGFKKHMDEMFTAFGEIKEYEIEVKEVSGKFFETNDFYLEAETMVHVQPCNAYSFVVKEKRRIDKKKLKKHKVPLGEHLQKLKQGKDVKYMGKKYSSKSLTFSEGGKKISFVLDTLMNDKIVPFVKNSDILVCESSFESALEKKASEYKHLTSKQAAEIAKKSKAGKLFLVHLSQRYSKKSQKILKEALKIFKKAKLPSDLDVVEA